MINGKKGKLYFKFVLAAAILITAIYAYSALAAVPSSTPAIVNTNTTTINSVQIANASIARVTDQLFGYANFSSDILTGVRSLPSLCSASNASQEENSTFKWLKRTLYQPQNRSLVGVIGVDKGYPLIADGNAIGDDREIA